MWTPAADLEYYVLCLDGVVYQVFQHPPSLITLVKCCFFSFFFFFNSTECNLKINITLTSKGKFLQWQTLSSSPFPHLRTNTIRTIQFLFPGIFSFSFRSTSSFSLFLSFFHSLLQTVGFYNYLDAASYKTGGKFPLHFPLSYNIYIYTSMIRNLPFLFYFFLCIRHKLKRYNHMFHNFK